MVAWLIWLSSTHASRDRGAMDFRHSFIGVCFQIVHSFGYGLTYGQVKYTAASYQNPASSKIIIPPSCKAALPGSTTGDPGCGSITVCAQVTNAKAAVHATEEVVQVYAAPKQGSIHGASL